MAHSAALMPPLLPAGKANLKAAIGITKCRRQSKLRAVVDERVRNKEMQEKLPTA